MKNCLCWAFCGWGGTGIKGKEKCPQPPWTPSPESGSQCGGVSQPSQPTSPSNTAEPFLGTVCKLHLQEEKKKKARKSFRISRRNAAVQATAQTGPKQLRGESINLTAACPLEYESPCSFYRWVHICLSAFWGPDPEDTKAAEHFQGCRTTAATIYWCHSRAWTSPQEFPDTCSGSCSPKPNLHSNKQRKLLPTECCTQINPSASHHPNPKLRHSLFSFPLSLSQAEYWDEKYPFRSLKSHSPVVESTLSGTASTCFVLFTGHLTHPCRTWPPPVTETKSSAEGLEQRRPSRFLWDFEHLTSSFIALPGRQTLREITAAQHTNVLAHLRYA